MSFIYIISTILVLVFLIVMLIGLVKPSLFNTKQGNTTERKTILIGSTVGIFISLTTALMTQEEGSALEKSSIEYTQENLVPKIDKISETESTLNEESLTRAEAQETPSQSVETEVVIPVMSISQENAISSAKQYLSFASFSRTGLIRQLSSDAGDGYNLEDAQFAVDYLDVNWKDQARKSAVNYLEITAFSCQGLIEQLSSDAGEGFTLEQAKYGAESTGICG